MKATLLLCFLPVVSLASSPGEAGAKALLPGRVIAAQTGKLQDEWPGIAAATNDWALALRHRPEWNAVLRASPDAARDLAAKGAALAQLRLGYSYFAGDGLTQDYAEALPWLQKAAQANLPPAQFLLGLGRLFGLGGTEDFSAAVDWFERAATNGFADAQFQLGVCYLNGGPGVNRAPARGVKWVQRAAEQGKAPAQLFLALCYSSGQGIDSDPAAAASWARQAAEQGLAEAQDFFGTCCSTGFGVKKNPVAAAGWFRKAAEQGLAAAQMKLAGCCSKGLGLSTNLAEAVKWWRQAADGGTRGAFFKLGLCYFNAQGLPRNLPAAADCFKQDAIKGHPGAQLYLGLCYWKGIGVDKDPDEAQKWWREAALKGIVPNLNEAALGGSNPYAESEGYWREVAAQANPEIQCCMAEFYHQGQGVAKNDLEALNWYKKAAAQGDAVALQTAAWLLATSPDPHLRDGQTALKFAQQAAQGSRRRSPKILDTLAAAYAEAGQFKQAVSTEKQAISLSTQDDEREEFQGRLMFYQTNAPYRSF